MAVTKVMTGARAVVSVNNNVVGIFETCTYNTNIGTEVIYTLGRYSGNEVTPTSYEAVTLSCSGFRTVGAGPHTGSPSSKSAAGPTVYMLQDLLNLEGVTIAVKDRQTNSNILIAIGCVATGYSGSHNARATSRVTINYTGLVLSDEAGNQDESQGATSLP